MSHLLSLQSDGGTGIYQVFIDRYFSCVWSLNSGSFAIFFFSGILCNSIVLTQSEAVNCTVLWNMPVIIALHVVFPNEFYPFKCFPGKKTNHNKDSFEKGMQTTVVTLVSLLSQANSPEAFSQKGQQTKFMNVQPQNHNCIRTLRASISLSQDQAGLEEHQEHNL